MLSEIVVNVHLQKVILAQYLIGWNQRINDFRNIANIFVYNAENISAFNCRV